jgi:lipoate-protein ligase A
MAVDEALLESAANEGVCTLRFYQWAEPTLSLGYFQTYADRWQHEASRQAALVRRSSGGGAILHDRELTYSIAVPDRHPLAVDRLKFYQTVHRTLIDTFAEWGIEARMFEATESRNAAPCYAGETNNAESAFLCFQRRAPGDILVGCEKVVGSAQRRCRGAVLQHGSVLLARSNVAPELAGLKELVDKILEPQRLIDQWLPHLAEDLSIVPENGGISDGERRRVVTLTEEKYASPSWNEYRGRMPETERIG